MKQDGARRWLPLLALVTVMTAGCQPKPVIEEKVPTLPRDAVLMQLNDRARATATLQADLSVKARSGEMRRAEKLDGYLAAAYPDKLRIRGDHPLLSYTVFDLGSDGTTWFFHFHFRDTNEIDYGKVASLRTGRAPEVPLRPDDIVVALGMGPLAEVPGYTQLLLTRNPGYYLFTEITLGPEAWIRRRVTVDGEQVRITRLETYRPDGGIDMIADLGYGKKSPVDVPTTARIVVLRGKGMLLDLTLKHRITGEPLKPKLWRMPDLEEIPKKIQHPAPYSVGKHQEPNAKLQTSSKQQIPTKQK